MALKQLQQLCCVLPAFHVLGNATNIHCWYRQKLRFFSTQPDKYCQLEFSLNYCKWIVNHINWLTMRSINSIYMRLNLAKLLCLLMLGTGTILPVHAYTHTDIEKNSEYNFVSDSHQNDNAQTSCDHCCHLSAHVLGILQTKPLSFVPRVIPYIHSISQEYTSRSLSPPYRPPIAWNKPVLAQDQYWYLFTTS